MNRYLSRGLWFALFVGGLSVAGATAANAAETGGDDGVASGSQAVVSLGAPIQLGGNAISLLGDSSSDGASTDAGPGSSAPTTASTTGDSGLASGTQGLISVAVPVTLGGNAVSVLGDSSSTEASTADAATPAPTAEVGSVSDRTAPTTSGGDGILGGSQVVPAAAVPVTFGGNAISVLGDSSSDGASMTAANAGAGAAGPGGAATSGSNGLLGGTQIAPVIALPIALEGNGISVIGDSTTTDATVPAGPTAPAGPATPTEPATPAEPGDPGTSSTLVRSGESVLPAGGAAVPLAMGALARTGSDATGALALVALFLLAGLLLVRGSTFVDFSRKMMRKALRI